MFFVRIFELDLLGHGHTILGDRRAAEFLVEDNVRPLGPSVALTAFESFSTPRRSACRAFSSKL